MSACLGDILKLIMLELYLLLLFKAGDINNINEPWLSDKSLAKRVDCYKALLHGFLDRKGDNVRF